MLVSIILDFIRIVNGVANSETKRSFTTFNSLATYHQAIDIILSLDFSEYWCHITSALWETESQDLKASHHSTNNCVKHRRSGALQISLILSLDTFYPIYTGCH